MPFLCGVVYSYNRNCYFIFDNAAELVSALKDNCTISFNGLNFDSRLLLGNQRKYKIDNPFFEIVSRETKWREFDLFLVILSSYFKSTLYDSVRLCSPGGLNLDALSKHTIRQEKIKIDHKKCTKTELIEYCLHDVRITRMLFEFAVKYGFVRSPKLGRTNISPRYLSHFRSYLKL